MRLPASASALVTLVMLVMAAGSAHAEDAAPPAAPVAEPPQPISPGPMAVAPPPPVTEAPAPPPLRPWRITPMVGFSVPRLAALELLVRYRRASSPDYDLFSFGVSGDWLPPDIIYFGPQTTVSWLQLRAEGKFFPWKWAFAGVGVGWSYARSDSENLGSEVDYLDRALVVMPKIGALYTFKSRFTIGGDIGVGIPLGADYVIHSDGQTDSNARKAARTLGEFALPELSFRVGYTFGG